MKYFSLTISIMLSIFCNELFSQTHWQGLGTGDAYLEIKDSVLTYNGPDYSISTCKIDSITIDSIFCSVYDQDTGIYKYAIQFSHSNNFNIISIKMNSEIQDFISINNTDMLKSHTIKSVHYRVYEYEGSLVDEIVVNQDGISKNGTHMAFKSKEDTTFQKVQELFEKVSKLDLDNFYEADKNFFMISHASCYCLEVHYNLSSSMLYCRQRHNNYISQILKEIKLLGN